MSRRSSRLLSGGYYNSDEESDSSNISYRENPVKVFKKKTANRKAASRTSTRANSNVSSASIDSHIIADLSPSPLSSQSELTMRTVPHVATTVTPRPALTPTATRSRTPAACPSLTPEKRPSAKLSNRPNHKVQSQGSIDSSGYSSSEGTSKKLTADASSRISNAFYNMKDYLSVMATAAQSKMMHLMDSAKNSSFSSHIMNAICFSVLLVSVIVCIWIFLPLLTSFVSRMPVTNTPSQTRPETQPVFPNTPPQPNTIHSTPVVNPGVSSASVESKAQRLLEELQVKQEHLRSQVTMQIEREMQHIRAELRTAHSSSYLQLEERVAELSRRMQDLQVDSHSAVAGLILKIQALEGQNAVLTRELASIQLLPPSTSCPSGASVHNQLTPELQRAMEKWLAEHVSAEDTVRFGGKGSPDSGHPIANKMADFALETQGASVISTRCSETYRIRSACVTLFGFPLWYPSESPRTVIQGFPVLLPGKCWAFHGVQGTLVISLSHPIWITQVTLDHLPRYNSPTGRIDSAPKDFEVYGMKNDAEEEGTLLGTFTYDKDGESTQTFQLPDPSDVVYRVVELRVLTNWGQVEYTCLYRFRVHGEIAAT